MKWGKKQKKTAGLLFSTAFVAIGVYNSVVVNSESFMGENDVKFVKRLDEVYGVVKVGRQIAEQGEWIKLAPTQKVEMKQAAALANTIVPKPVFVNNSSSVSSSPEVAPIEAAVQEELELSLVEAVNQKKYPQGLANTQFSGSLSARNGTIESIQVSLPSDSIDISFSEMTGNVFEYDYEGQVYSGMFYQVDQSSYMVTLTNGPLEGTRLKFSTMIDTQTVQENNEEVIAQNQVEVQAGEFGQDQQPQENLDVMMQDQAQEMSADLEVSQGYNFGGDQQAAL